MAGEMRDSRAQTVSASCSNPIHLSLWMRCFRASTSTCLADGFLPASVLTDCIGLSSIRAISASWLPRSNARPARVSSWNLGLVLQPDKHRNRTAAGDRAYFAQFRSNFIILGLITFRDVDLSVALRKFATPLSHNRHFAGSKRRANTARNSSRSSGFGSIQST